MFPEKEFCKHFPHCQQFKSEFRKFDNDLGNLLKEYSKDSSNLPIIKILFSQYISAIDRKIKQRNPNKINDNINMPSQSSHGRNIPSRSVNEPPSNINNPPSQFQSNSGSQFQNHSGSQFQDHSGSQFQDHSGSQFQNNQRNPNNFPVNPGYDPHDQGYPNLNPNSDSNNPFNSGRKYGGNAFQDPQPQNNYQEQEDVDIISCQICHTMEIDYLDCCHAMCKSCFTKYAETDFYNMKCKICNELITPQYKKLVLGEEKCAQIEKKINDEGMKKFSGNMVECPGCHNRYPFEPGKSVDYNVRDDKNQRISRESAEHYAKNRVRCPSCQAVFCAKCSENPYHVGYTCEQYQQRKQALKCRFDQVTITASNRGPDNDVCNNPECIERFRIACKKRLPCGHRCLGTVNDNCPPCLYSDCKDYQNLYDQDADAYCTICYSESLESSPIVTLSCNHYVHFLCIKKRLETRWVGPKITFNHCLCPTCNNWYDCSNPTIHSLVQINKKLYDDICEKALKRLVFEDLHKDPKLTNPNSKWYGKKLEYALNRLSYYMCFKCKEPYFAGRRECGDGPNVDNNNPNRQYDPKDCICGKCSNLSGVAGITECKKHGKEFIEYKCKFCCKIASWFCWGTTHFCEDCHVRQCKGDYVSKYPKEKLPKCNPATCELKVKHPPNGEEFALGCSICRNSEENAKDF